MTLKYEVCLQYICSFCSLFELMIVDYWINSLTFGASPFLSTIVYKWLTEISVLTLSLL